MATKTRAELMTEIDQKNEEIKKLEEEIKMLEKYKQCKDMGDEFKAMYTAFEVAGFTSDQAFTLLIETLKAAPAYANNSTAVKYRNYLNR